MTERPARILLDGSSMQVQAHTRSEGTRLRDLIKGLTSRLGAEVIVGQDAPLSSQSLASADVLVIATRDRPYPVADLSEVEDFVMRGGGLLLLTNHADLPGVNQHNCAREDAVMAGRLGLVIEEAFFKTTTVGVLTIMRVPSSEHPVLLGPAGPVHSIVVGNCTSLLDRDAVGLVPLPHDAVDLRDNRSVEGRFAFVAAERGQGKVIVGADSGLAGSWETLLPGPGLIDRADNLALLLNAIAWLANH